MKTENRDVLSRKDHVNAYDCLVRLHEVSGGLERIQS
jgi:hypothetical protein